VDVLNSTRIATLFSFAPVACVAYSAQVLKFFSQREKERVSSRRRIAVVLVGFVYNSVPQPISTEVTLYDRDDTSIPIYASSLRELFQNDINLKIGVFESSMSNAGHWEELFCKDVVVLHSHVLFILNLQKMILIPKLGHA
jgi:hypothetical protein